MRYARNIIFFAMVLAALVALGGCASTTHAENTPARPGLPAVPVDIRQCLNAALGNVPERDLTVAEVETMWKSDRVRFVVMRKCGGRFLAWYDDLRARWR